MKAQFGAAIPAEGHKVKKWSEMSAIAQGATVAVLIFPVTWVVGTLAYSGDSETALIAAVIASVFCGCFIPALIGDRQTFGSAERFRGYKRALRTGELPDDAEPAVWRGWLDRSRKQNRSRLALAALIAIVAAISVLSTVIRWALTDLDLTNSSLLTALMALGAIAYFVHWHRQRRRIARLAAMIEQRITTAR